jgi:hypothetical protein
MNNVKTIDQYMTRTTNSKMADGVQADSDARAKPATMDPKYNRWEENRMHGEREMENKALDVPSDQLLPTHEP